MRRPTAKPRRPSPRFWNAGRVVRVFLDEGALKPGQDLADKAREARLADIALLLFSRQSMPSRWPRAAWEAALIHEPAAEGVRMAFARLDDCLPPAVLQPRFELAGLSTKGLRALKRWIRNAELPPAAELAAGLDALGVALADRAGVETVASPALARQFADAFPPISTRYCISKTAPIAARRPWPAIWPRSSVCGSRATWKAIWRGSANSAPHGGSCW